MLHGTDLNQVGLMVGIVWDSVSETRYHSPRPV